LASCFEGGKTSDFHWLASKCVSLVLEMEVAAGGKACRSSRDESVDSENGVGESDVGTIANRSGIAAENRYSIVTSNRCQVYAQTRSKTLE
jgi:hypothetical protein